MSRDDPQAPSIRGDQACHSVVIFSFNAPWLDSHVPDWPGESDLHVLPPSPLYPRSLSPLQVAHENLHLHILPAVGGASGERVAQKVGNPFPHPPLVCGEPSRVSGGGSAMTLLLALLLDPSPWAASIYIHTASPMRTGVGESLVEAAQKLQATLLVLGTRGMGSVKR